MDAATHVAYTGLVNFTNSNPSGASSANCLVNSLIYDESAPLQVLFWVPSLCAVCTHAFQMSRPRSLRMPFCMPNDCKLHAILISNRVALPSSG